MKLSKKELANILFNLRADESVSMVVDGDSMRPTIKPGETVRFAKATSDTIAPGDVGLFIEGGRVVVHRFIGHKLKDGENVMITKGDHSPLVEYIKPRQVIGRVTAVESNGRLRPLPAGAGPIILRPSVQNIYLWLNDIAVARRSVIGRPARLALRALSIIDRLRLAIDNAAPGRRP